jgi:hypothetical protein
MCTIRTAKKIGIIKKLSILSSADKTLHNDVHNTIYVSSLSNINYITRIYRLGIIQAQRQAMKFTDSQYEQPF